MARLLETKVKARNLGKKEVDHIIYKWREDAKVVEFNDGDASGIYMCIDSLEEYSVQEVSTLYGSWRSLVYFMRKLLLHGK